MSKARFRSIALLLVVLVTSPCSLALRRVTLEDYLWNRTTQSAVEYMTGFGLKTCADTLRTKPDYSTTTCTNLRAFRCTCVADCEVYGSCCYDHERNKLTEAAPETTGCLRDNFYAMVKCPQSWGDGDVREACETGQGKYTVDEPVTDLSTNVTFRNAFCAQCHGVESYTPWRLLVTCKHFQNVYMCRSEEEFLDLVQSQKNSFCKRLRRMAPAGIEPSYCLSNVWFSDAVDTCNVTGGWATDDYDADVEQNCLLYKSLSLGVGDYRSFYKNLFCAVCNGVRAQTCECQGEDSGILVPEIDQHTGAPLTLLLGPRDRDTDSDDRHRLDTCSDGQWADFTYLWNKSVPADVYLSGYGPNLCVDGQAQFTDGQVCGPDIFPCDCSPHCASYGTCCSDRVPDRMIIQPMVHTTGCLQDTAYAMVRCPYWTDELDITEACETGQGKYTFDEPVTDPNTNITYRNAFCAQCHGVESYTTWDQLNVTCTHFQHVLSAVSREQLLDMAKQGSSPCTATRAHPDELVPSYCTTTTLGSGVIIGKCNVTGQWPTEDYDADVESNCLLHRYGVLLWVPRDRNAYRNMFCALCNGVVPEVDQDCSDFSGSGPGYEKVRPPMSLLLGLRGSPAGDELQDVGDCSSSHWLDHA
ncbi:hypothetical protein BaRGS_00015409, partial [Batillaria attramentaria]